MKKTQIKDTRRNIWKEKVSFLSIMIIALIAVASFLGINLGADGLFRNADKFYQRQNFRDFEINSTLLLDEEDMSGLRKIEGVSDVEGVYVDTGKVVKGDGFADINVVSLTDRINTVDLLEGELPESTSECVVEEELAKILEVSVGEKITITNAEGEKPALLVSGDFTIVGIVHHPDLYAMDNQIPGSRYVLVKPESFDKKALEGCYMKALLQIEKPEGISYFAEEYRELTSEIEEKIHDLSSEREKMRTEKVKNNYREELKPIKAELDDAKKKLDSTKKELDEGEKKLKEGEAELEEGKKKLDEASAELKKSEAKLNEGREELLDASDELDSAKAELDKGNDKLIDSYNEIEEKKEEIRKETRNKLGAILSDEEIKSVNWSKPSYINDASYSDLTAKYFYITDDISPIDLSTPLENQISKIENAIADALTKEGYEEYVDDVLKALRESGYYESLGGTYNEARNAVNKWDEGHAEYMAGFDKYNKGLSEYNSGVTEYEDALAKYNSGLAEYNTGLAEYEASQTEIEDGKAKLKDGKTKYEEGLKQYEEGLEEYNKSVERIENIGPCHFVVLDARGNASYVHGENSAINIQKVGKTFAALFVVLGALVIYATVSRIIDEQRQLVGTQKALGFFSSEVFKKHLAFGALATFVGMILGALTGYFLVEKIILIALEQLYVTGVIPRVFNFKMAAIILVIGTLLAGLAVYWACSHLLKETAKALMQPPAPKGRKKTETKKTRGSLYSRLIVRNMLTEWRRVLITIISIAGCCVLLVIGFSIQYSITDAISYQFDNIEHYDAYIEYDSSTSETVEKDIESSLKEDGIDYINLSYKYYNFDTPDGLSAAKLMVVDPDEIKGYFDVKDYQSREEMRVPEEGVIITRKIADVHQLAIGDTFTMYNEAMDPFEAKVAGICDYYLGKIMIISDEGYKKLFGEPAKGNTFWITGDFSEEEVKGEVSAIKGFGDYVSTEETIEGYIESSSVLSIITYVLILAAGLMAYFVLLNLISMYLNQKKRELTVMRINGFTTKEVIRYVAGESVLTTILGIILGIIVGGVLGYMIVSFLEQSQFGLVKTPNLKGWMYSAVLTGIFSLIINAIALRKVKHLKLSDIA